MITFWFFFMLIISVLHHIFAVMPVTPANVLSNGTHAAVILGAILCVILWGITNQMDPGYLKKSNAPAPRREPVEDEKSVMLDMDSLADRESFCSNDTRFLGSHLFSI
jgi:hypothetical protein